MEENLLTPFDWDPNPHIRPQGLNYTLRIKDRFIVKFKDKECVYTDLEECFIEFRAIYHDNLDIVFKCHELQDKLKKIVEPDHYVSYTETENAGLTTGKVSSIGQHTSNTNMLSVTKSGSLSGTGDASSIPSLYSEASKAVMLQGIIDKKEDAHMQYLDPNIREYSQSYTKNTGEDTRQSIDSTSSNTMSMGASTTKFKTTRSIEAVNHMQALSVRIPKLISEFLEAFNALFYV